MADPVSLSQNPFAVLSLIAAPAVLTNAASVLAMSTSNRFLRASERMRTLSARLEAENAGPDTDWMLVQVGRVERQAVWLLSALRGAYVALASFVSASLISILGAALASEPALHAWSYGMIVLALVAGFVGAGGLVWGCTRLFRATRLSMLNVTEEGALLRERAKARRNAAQQLSPRVL